MSVKVYWLDASKTLLTFKFIDTFTISDLREADKISADLTSDIQHPFHLIYNFLEVKDISRLPQGLYDYLQENLQHSSYLEHIIVVIAKDGEVLARTVILIAKALWREYLTKLHTTSPQEDAIQHLKKLDLYASQFTKPKKQKDEQVARLHRV